jgi:aryl-alcohol dehydrogenase-like predicted oxidoreductase
MQFTTLGRTGLRTSVAGLGCGGHSRLGQAYGKSADESLAVVSAALDAGVNFIDTAAAYGTESIVGKALRGRREQTIISSKTLLQTRASNPEKTPLILADELIKRLHDSLARLQTDYIDIYNMHGVLEAELDHVEAELLPTLLDLKQQGKIRFLGITERFVADTSHQMLQRAIETNAWDVVMVGFNLLNPSARHSLLRRTRELNLGVQDMFAVRRALSDPATLGEALKAATAAGQINAEPLTPADRLDEILLQSGARTLVDLAYRFCRHEPGIHVVLTGTGNVDHLAENLASINGPPLPAHTQTGLAEVFGHVDSVSGN